MPSRLHSCAEPRCRGERRCSSRAGLQLTTEKRPAGLVSCAAGLRRVVGLVDVLPANTCSFLEGMGQRRADHKWPRPKVIRHVWVAQQISTRRFRATCLTADHTYEWSALVIIAVVDAEGHQTPDTGAEDIEHGGCSPRTRG